MEKLNVKVGFVFTQVMFCDGQGKLQFHRVLTDVDKPWESVKELLGLVKQTLTMDKPKIMNNMMRAIHVEFEYKTIQFMTLLTTLRNQLLAAFSNLKVMIEGLEEEVCVTEEQGQVVDVAMEFEESVVRIEEAQELSNEVGMDGMHPSFMMYKEEGSIHKVDNLSVLLGDYEGPIPIICGHQRGSPVVKVDTVDDDNIYDVTSPLI